MNFLDIALALFDVRAVMIAGLVFIPLERLRPLHRGQHPLHKGWRTDMIYVFANGALLSMGLGALITVTPALSTWLVSAELRAAVARQPYWMQVIEAVILADLGFYVAHRLFHGVPWLWRFHAIHHSIQELDWLAGFRVHVLDQLVTKGVSMLPLLVLGFDAVPIAISVGLYFWHSILLHANVRMSFGPLRWIIASPVFHHWHHAACPDAYGKNFAGQLSILDKLFGTMYMPKGQTPESYGLDEPVPHTYITQMMYPLKWVLR